MNIEIAGFHYRITSTPRRLRQVENEHDTHIVLQERQAYSSFLINPRMIDLRSEFDLWVHRQRSVRRLSTRNAYIRSFERELLVELHVEDKLPILVWTFWLHRPHMNISVPPPYHIRPYDHHKKGRRDSESANSGRNKDG